MDTKMKAKRAQEMFKIDLTMIEGDGDFPCPKCGNIISPDDQTEEAYNIVDTKMKGDILEELVVVCSKCGSRIHIVGFLQL
jgi:predicted RNA-binding Zn-ribbon protein involved in translation (DUF1610 family)